MLTDYIGPEFNPGFEFIPAYTGAQVFRREDDDLLVGRGEYVADIQLSGMVEAAFLRSYSSHAQLKSVDLDAVRKFPGVLFAGSHDDLPGIAQYPDRIVYQQAVTQSPLADGRVRYVGAPVAVVVARKTDCMVFSSKPTYSSKHDFDSLRHPGIENQSDCSERWWRVWR